MRCSGCPMPCCLRARSYTCSMGMEGTVVASRTSDRGHCPPVTKTMDQHRHTHEHEHQPLDQHVDADRALPAAQYTCPMHPEVLKDGPGDCPICGMALVPVGAAAADEDNAELRDHTRRLWVGVVLSIPMVILAMTPLVGIAEPFGLAPRVRRAGARQHHDAGRVRRTEDG